MGADDERSLRASEANHDELVERGKSLADASLYESFRGRCWLDIPGHEQQEGQERSTVRGS